MALHKIPECSIWITSTAATRLLRHNCLGRKFSWIFSSNHLLWNNLHMSQTTNRVWFPWTLPDSWDSLLYPRWGVISDCGWSSRRFLSIYWYQCEFYVTKWRLYIVFHMKWYNSMESSKKPFRWIFRSFSAYYELIIKLKI